MRKLVGIKPERVFYHFEEISKIPRESYHEKAISDYLVEFGKKLIKINTIMLFLEERLLLDMKMLLE